MATPKKKIGVRGVGVSSQARELIANVIEFIKREAEEVKQTGSTIIPLSKFKERILAATKISEKVYRSVVNEKNSIEAGTSSRFTSPKKQRQKLSPKQTLPVGEEEEIRRIIYDYALIHKRRPSLKCILEKIKESGLAFEGKITTLRCLLQNMGFRYVGIAFIFYLSLCYTLSPNKFIISYSVLGQVL